MSSVRMCPKCGEHKLQTREQSGPVIWDCAACGYVSGAQAGLPFPPIAPRYVSPK